MRDLLSNDPELMAQVETVHFPALLAYFRNAIEVRTSMADRPDDVLTRLVEAKVGGRDMTTDEQLQTLNLLFQPAGPSPGRSVSPSTSLLVTPSWCRARERPRDHPRSG